MVPRYKALESDTESVPTGDTAMRSKLSLAFASVIVCAAATLPGTADAACKKFGFTVNDYGKEGPTNDAKNLLDKHISEWASKNGVTDYQTGKKSVNCELFLDVILFDEHTCTASATVCWGADAKKLGSQSAAAPEDDGSAGAPPHPVRKAEALGQAAPQQAAAPAETDAAAAQQVEAAPTTPVEQIAAPAETPASAPAVHAAPAGVESMTPAAAAAATTDAVVETGALQTGQALAQPTAQKVTAPAAPVSTDKDRAAAAAAAASAAAAAERAAVAAETAASAAKEAAAAAVAASAASKAPAVVPPLDHASGAAPAHNE